MNYEIMVHNTEMTIEEANGDYFKAAEMIHNDYHRGLYTEAEMLEMMDVLAAKMMFS